MLGTGQQHWSNVHVADLAEVFRRVLEDDTARGYYVIGNGLNPTVDYFAEVLLLDQGTDAARARAELDWQPSHRSLTDEFSQGSYRAKVTAG
jgi:nucleoside-diphosphate-sugar epimerase